MRRKNSGKRERGWKFLIAVQTSNFKTRAAIKKKRLDTHGVSTFLYLFNYTNSGKINSTTNKDALS